MLSRLCQKGTRNQAPVNTNPGPKAKNCHKTSSLLRLKPKASQAATGFLPFIPSLRHLYRVWVISASKKQTRGKKKKKKLDYKGLHESNKII